MKKVIAYLFGVLLFLLVSCSNGIVEKEVSDLIVFSNSFVEQKTDVPAHFKLNYNDDNVIAYVSCDHGKLNDHKENEVIEVKSDEVVSFDPSGFGNSVCYITIILKEDDSIVGYGLIRADLKYIGEDDNMYRYDLCVVKSVVFKSANASEEYVLEQIEKCIDSYTIPPLGGDD